MVFALTSSDLPKNLVASARASGGMIYNGCRIIVRRHSSVINVICSPEELVELVGNSRGREILDQENISMVASQYVQQERDYQKERDTLWLKSV